MQKHEDDPIEAYLDALIVAFGAHNPKALRDLLFEIDVHLQESVAHNCAEGMDVMTAKHKAVADLGLASELARIDQERLRPSVVMLVRQFVCTALLLLSVAAVVVGVSGVLSEAANLAWGNTSVAGVGSSHLFAASDCARWLGNDPGATSCRDAAVADWTGEVVVYRVVAGVGGLVGLGGLWLLRVRVRLLPSIVLCTIGALGFGATVVGTLTAGINGVIFQSGAGIWQWFSATIAATFALSYFGWRMLQSLRTPSHGVVG